MPEDLFAAVKEVGAAGGIIFFILWWLERQDKKAIIERFGNSIHKLALALEVLKDRGR